MSQESDYVDVDSTDGKVYHSVGVFGEDGAHLVYEAEYDRSLDDVPLSQFEDIRNALEKQEMNVDYLRDSNYDDAEIID